ncbi:general substrate transporter [Plectosphaerella plurivora]|uniref:General substrate transporter n=1 Tax=Plectosphaerella plurivora TaxID=936078 RepID=A0A9P8VHJ8_9PEZI|nr:general substrate transporter [Plectosphaerella plurivora]
MADTETKRAVTEDQIEANRADISGHNDASLDDKALNVGAAAGNEAEHNIGVFQAFKTYKRAAFWSIAISTTIIMEGYDVTLLGSFYGYPEFRKAYGVWLNEESGYQISSYWQTMFNVLGAVANIVGALINGWATARWGHRKVLIGSLAWLTCFIFIVFFAPNIETQLAGQVLCNVPWGVFATTPPAYAAEVAPLAIRAYLTAYVNLCWAMGQFISAGVLAGLVNYPGVLSFKIPFALQWIWPIPLGLLAYFAPESPWFLVRTGQLEAARNSLVRLSEPSHNVDLDATIAMMVHTDKTEKDEQAGTTYLECFKGTNLRRTEIACMSFLSQITNGGALCYSGSFFFQQIGLKADVSYYIGLGGTGIAFLGTCISWLYIYRWGRRTIWLAGFSVLVCILWLIGILASVNQTPSIEWAQALLCIVWLGAYSMSVGPIVYTLVAEVGSTRLRTQTVVLARSTYYVGNIVCGGFIQPQLLPPDAANLKGQTAFFWAALATPTLVWGYFRQFETKDRTFGEMEYMFLKGVSARQSAKFVIDEQDQFVLTQQETEDNHVTQVKT